MATQSLSASRVTYPGDRGVVGGATTPAQRRERERLAVLEAQIAQTCYELSRLRAEHRRIRGHLALVEAPGLGALPMPANPG